MITFLTNKCFPVNTITTTQQKDNLIQSHLEGLLAALAVQAGPMRSSEGSLLWTIWWKLGLIEKDIRQPKEQIILAFWDNEYLFQGGLSYL